jgi:hypothetical protein
VVLGERPSKLPGGFERPEPHEPLFEPCTDDLLEIRLGREAGRHLEFGQVRLALRQRHIAPLRDVERVRQCLRPVAEDGTHLVGGLQKELIAVIPEPLLVADVLARADAEKHVVRMPVGLPQIVDVVGADEGQPEIARDWQEAGIHRALLVNPLILHFEEEVAGAEDVAKRGRRLEGLAWLFGPEPGRDLALQAAAEANQPARVLGEPRFVDPRLVIEAVGVSRRDQADQVVEALIGLGEQHEVVGRFAGLSGPIGPAARGDVDLTAEDGLDSALARLVVKGDGREQIAVFGDRDGRHLQLGHAIEQLAHPAGAVEERELRVQVQMNELAHGSFPLDRRRGLRADVVDDAVDAANVVHDA